MGAFLQTNLVCPIKCGEVKPMNFLFDSGDSSKITMMFHHLADYVLSA